MKTWNDSWWCQSKIVTEHQEDKIIMELYNFTADNKEMAIVQDFQTGKESHVETKKDPQM